MSILRHLSGFLKFHTARPSRDWARDRWFETAGN
jgi:hypothetical protein